jgi:hypothetical protein
MTDVVTFLGLGRGAGNATMARAFAASTSGSNHCVLVEADRTDDSTFDWASRRKATRSQEPVTVRHVGITDCLNGDALEAPEGFIILQTAYSNDAVATELARKSRLTILTTRPTNVDMAKNLFRQLVTSGIPTDAIAVLLCEPNPDDSIDMEAALRSLAAAGIKAHGVPFLGRHVADLLREKGWTIEESARPSPVLEGEAMIGFIQVTYLDAPETSSTPRLPKD